jgi:hypothetical protein
VAVLGTEFEGAGPKSHFQPLKVNASVYQIPAALQSRQNCSASPSIPILQSSAVKVASVPKQGTSLPDMKGTTPLKAAAWCITNILFVGDYILMWYMYGDLEGS